MTESDPVTAIEIIPEALADARAIVAAHVVQMPSGRCVLDQTIVEQLTDSIALAIQGHIHAAELAEAERVQAVRIANAMRHRLIDLANMSHVEQWATCPRCHARAPSVMELKHQAGCRLSSAPPPRRSLIAPKPGGEG